MSREVGAFPENKIVPGIDINFFEVDCPGNTRFFFKFWHTLPWFPTLSWNFPQTEETPTPIIAQLSHPFFSFQNLTCFFFLICITRDVRQILRNLFRCLGDIREPEVWLFTENQNTGWIYILSCSGLFIHKNPLTRTLGHIFILWIMYPNVPWNPLNVIHITIIDKHKFTDIFLWPPSVFFFFFFFFFQRWVLYETFADLAILCTFATKVISLQCIH